MSKLAKIMIAVLALLALLVLVGPLVIPIPALQGTVPPQQLADRDSRFVEIDDLTMHYKQAGQGNPALLLLHGFAASTYSWREVMQPLAESHQVVAFDRPAFGLTERLMPEDFANGVNPYSVDAQADQTVGLMDALGIDQAVLIGNSAGGTVAVSAALRYPQRVQALVLVDPAIAMSSRSSALVRWLLSTPQARRLGPLFVRNIRNWGYQFGQSAWHDPSRFTDEIWNNYQKPLQAENWDRALWELTRASRPLNLDQRLAELQMPVLVITGDDDRIVPTERSIRLAGEIPGAGLAVLPNCGHVPQEECPAAFLAAVEEFLGQLNWK